MVIKTKVHKEDLSDKEIKNIFYLYIKKYWSMKSIGLFYGTSPLIIGQIIGSAKSINPCKQAIEKARKKYKKLFKEDLI